MTTISAKPTLSCSLVSVAPLITAEPSSTPRAAGTASSTRARLAADSTVAADDADAPAADNVVIPFRCDVMWVAALEKFS